MIKTTQEFPIIGKYFYVMDFSNMLKPKLIPLYFLNRNAAKRAIKSNVRRNSRKIYSIFKGEKLMGYNLPYVLKKGTWQKFTKYEYKPNLTYQNKKSLRTQMRRRLRRMNLLTSIKVRNLYYSAPQYVKLVKNKQKVANSPNTSAKAFQLERKPKTHLYLIIKKMAPKRRSYLVSFKVLRINIKTHDYSLLKLNIHKTDIIIPYLLKEVFNLIEALPNKLKIIKLYTKKIKHGTKNY